MFSAWLTLKGYLVSSCLFDFRTPKGRDSCGKRDCVCGVRNSFPVEAGSDGWRPGEAVARSAIVSVAVAVAALVCLSTSAAHAGHQHLESWYSKALAEQLPGAKTEVRMHNGTRCDVLATHHSIEVEFASKWCESIGQSLNYSAQTGRMGAVALILEHDSDERFLTRLRQVISWHQLPIAVIVLRPFEERSLTIELPPGIAVKPRLPAVDFRSQVQAMDFLETPAKR